MVCKIIKTFVFQNLFSREKDKKTGKWVIYSILILVTTKEKIKLWKIIESQEGCNFRENVQGIYLVFKLKRKWFSKPCKEMQITVERNVIILFRLVNFYKTDSNFTKS